MPGRVPPEHSIDLEALAARGYAENRGVVVTEAGSYLRLIDFCITQLKAQDLPGSVTRVKKKKKSR